MNLKSNLVKKPGLSLLGKIVLCGSSLFLLAWTILHMLPGYYRPGFQACPNSLWDLATPLVGLGFWIASLVALATRQPFITVAFLSLGSAVLSAGFLSGMGNDLAGRGFYILLAWFSPVFLHFHLAWTLRSLRRPERIALLAFYILAGLAAIPFLTWTIDALNAMGWFPFLRSGVRIILVISVLATVSFLAARWRGTPTTVDHHRIRLAITSVVLASFPLLLLSLLPELSGLAFVPYEVNFVWLLIIPLGYGYSILRQKTIRGNALLVRLAGYYLAGVFFASLYTIALQTLERLIPSWPPSWTYLSAGFGIAALFILVRANHLTGRMIEWLLYGDDRGRLERLSQMAQSLGTVLHRDELRAILVDHLTTLIPGYQSSALFLKTGECQYALQGKTGFNQPGSALTGFRNGGTLSAFLSHSAPLLDVNAIHKRLARSKFLPEERDIAFQPGISLWIPLLSGDELHGLWLVGLDPGAGVLSEADWQVWSILARQAGVTAHNVLLSEAIRAGQDELATAHQGLLLARDEERREIARELHDSPLQDLLGLNLQLAILVKKLRQIGWKGRLTQDALNRELDSLRQGILAVSDKMREIIGELRPEGPLERGLQAALEDFIAQMEQKTGNGGPSIELQFDQKFDSYSDPLKTTLFRITQEAVRNALKYAQARHIFIILKRGESTISLTIKDDGGGFEPPTRLSELVRSNHYGLLGISERASTAGGRLNVRSRPGNGTEIVVTIPLIDTADMVKELPHD